MSKRGAFASVVALVACSRDAPGPIRKEPIDAGPSVLRPADLVVATPNGSPRAGDKVPLVAIVAAKGPPHALALGFVQVPLVDGAIPVARAMPTAGHEEARLVGTVLGTGRSARYAVDAVTVVPTTAVSTTIAEIVTRPDDFDERRVAIVGTFTRSDEHSTLDDVAWLSGCVREPSDGERAFRRRVRVEGWVFTRTHGIAGFGHTNGYRLHVEADRCEPAP